MLYRSIPDHFRSNINLSSQFCTNGTKMVMVLLLTIELVLIINTCAYARHCYKTAKCGLKEVSHLFSHEAFSCYNL